MKPLNTLEDLENCLAQSESEPVLLFKHSTTCPVSASAHGRLTRFLQETPGAPACWLVRVIESRPVSNEIAATLGVTHQSPQLLLVRDREAVWNASHNAIAGDAIAAALEDHQR